MLIPEGTPLASTSSGGRVLRTLACIALLLTAYTVSARSETPTQSPAMVVTANPHATHAGEWVLQQGGSSVDAAIAIEAVLSLVEPQSSGLGGGGFMMYLAGETHEIAVYDGREVAPAGASPTMFLDDTGTPLPFLAAKNSGLSIGVPGVLAMLKLAHEEHGSLPWPTLFEPAQRLAIEGFEVSPRLASFVSRYNGRLIPLTPEDGPMDAYHYFYDQEGKPRTRLVNPAYAKTLEIIAEDPDVFYRGPLAQAIVAAAKTPPRAGTLSLEDLAGYRAVKRSPLCIDYRQQQVCGPPPASSWVGVGMMLGLLEHTSFPTGDREDDWAMVIEAQQLAYADRDHYVADASKISVPLAGMLNKTYLGTRAKLINPKQAIDKVTQGNPWAFEPGTSARSTFGADTTDDRAGTTHFVVVDHGGNVVSMTASVESIFGSARMVGGMFLNNQLTDFARDPFDGEGKLVANHAAPGKYPRSSMSPTIVLDRDGDFLMATGSPGGNSILAYTLKTLVGVLDWGLTPQQAVDLPNVVARGESVRIESSIASPTLVETMRQRGFNVKESSGENSGLSVVVRTPTGDYLGGVDPRREGTIASVKPPGSSSTH
jgi:gamma-glutamyltranspeptidase/glutathione hydrolase